MTKKPTGTWYTVTSGDWRPSGFNYDAVILAVYGAALEDLAKAKADEIQQAHPLAIVRVECLTGARPHVGQRLSTPSSPS